jgi:hypothetical protein
VQIKTSAEDEAYGVANVTPNKHVQPQISLYVVETEATTWSLADTERVTDQVQREIHGIIIGKSANRL